MPVFWEWVFKFLSGQLLKKMHFLPSSEKAVNKVNFCCISLGIPNQKKKFLKFQIIQIYILHVEEGKSILSVIICVFFSAQPLNFFHGKKHF